ncbi:MAG: TIGR00341 family protein [Ignavibacteria bacterium]
MQIDPNEKEVYIERNFFSQDVPVEERTNVFNKLFFHYKKDWQGSFGLMLFLSVGIACLGLSEDSTAVIIGAMIIAPLGQPIIALGGTISLGWGKQSFRMLKIIFIGTISTLAVSFIFGFILPNDTPNQQILIRTSPDLRDMGIAILAGAAGAYGYFRSEFSTILSGVAIAVALVPPLCTCGLMLEQGHFILAGGSFLLFITNFIGITFSALLLFFLLGIRHKRNLKWFYTVTVTVILLGTSCYFPTCFEL